MGTNEPDPGPGTLTGLELIDRACDRYEATWRAGGRPAVEDFLRAEGLDPAAAPPDLLRELARVEAEHRARAGDPPADGEYERRFPQLRGGPAGGPDGGRTPPRARAVDREPDSTAPPGHAPDTATYPGSGTVSYPPAGPAADPGTLPTIPGSVVELELELAKYRELAGTLPTIPGYAVEAKVGHGGMGEVYKARDLRLNRPAAIKMILGKKCHDPAARARFLVEAEAVAQLDHPHVVRVHEFGTHDGLPFFALEWVGGGTLAERVKRDGKLTPRAAAGLMVKITEGIAAAHAKGIIHRDLKPANILLTEAGEPKVADFGLAKVGQSDMTATGVTLADTETFTVEAKVGQSDMTATGAVMGTPSYMSPEQAAGRVREIGTHSDVYALGALLYELLTGRPPFKGDSTIATMQLVLTREPDRLRTIDSAVPRDLETITLKCLEKDTRKRYGTASELAADLQAFLDGRPIAARPVSRIERTVKWVRRRPALAAITALACAAAVAALVLLGIHLRDVELIAAAFQNEGEAKGKEAEAVGALVATKGKLAEAVGALDATNGELAEQKQMLGRKQQEVKETGYVADMLAASAGWEANNPRLVRDRLGKYRPGSGQEGLRGSEWFYLWRLAHANRLTLDQQKEITCVAVSLDGEVIASGSADGNVFLWDAVTGQNRGKLPGANRRANGLAFSPDGTTLAVGSADGRVYLLDVGLQKKMQNLPANAGPITHLLRLLVLLNMKPVENLPANAGPVTSVAFAPDRPILVAGTFDGPVIEWDLETRKEVRRLLAHKGYAVRTLTFSRDGASLATASQDRSVCVWGRVGDKPRFTLRGHEADVTALAFSPDDKVLATADRRGAVRVWDAATGEPRREKPFYPHQGDVLALTFTSDGTELITGSTDRTARVWNAATGQERAVIKGHEKAVTCLALADNGQELVTGSQDGTVKVWRLSGEGGRTVLPSLPRPPGAVLCVAWSPDGKTLVTGGGTGTKKEGGWVEVRGANKPPVVWRGHENSVTAVAFSPDGGTLATASADKTVLLRGMAEGDVRFTLQHDGPVGCLAFSRDGKQLASADSSGQVKSSQVILWDPATGAKVKRLRDHPLRVRCVAFSADGRTLAAGHDDGKVVLWDLGTGQERGRWQAHGRPVSTLAFSPDGTQLATGSDDGTAALWAWETRSDAGPPRVASFEDLGGSIRSLAFTPDGRTLITAARSVKLWHLATGLEVATLPTEPYQALCVAITPDGRRLAAGTYDGPVLVWEAAGRYDGRLRVWEGDIDTGAIPPAEK